jgi:hypothetical protein
MFVNVIEAIARYYGHEAAAKQMLLKDHFGSSETMAFFNKPVFKYEQRTETFIIEFGKTYTYYCDRYGKWTEKVQVIIGGVKVDEYKNRDTKPNLTFK